jgi:hypothetical protein
LGRPVALGSLLTAGEAGAAVPKTEILGRWKGTSICTKIPGNEFCRDEVVVYEFVDVASEPDAVKLKAAKIVEGREEPMYEVEFRYEAGQRRWACEFVRPRAHGIWMYAVRGRELTGTLLLLPDRAVARNVAARREAVAAPAGRRVRYEAMVFVGYDNASERYVAHWIDVYGGRFSETLGYGRRENESVQFVFEYPDGPFHNTFQWDPKASSWTFLLESKRPSGQWLPFAEDRLQRAE